MPLRPGGPASLTPERALDLALADVPRNRPVGLAVSGGGDSTALLHVAAARAVGVPLLAATVDHGLRPAGAEEAATVARACAALGVPHETLRWDDWDGRGNLQDAARAARRRLLAAWARRRGAGLVLLAHTADDQAETVLLRLARGSGVDGLAGMAPFAEGEGMAWARPFLTLGREDLRGWLRARGIAWAEDPSNDDPRFDRVRARAMMASLADLGLTRDRLLRTAGHMGRARRALRAAAVAWAEDHARVEGGDVVLDALPALGTQGSDTDWRVLAAAVRFVGGRAPHAPRWEALAAAAGALREGRAATLGGCLLGPEEDGVRVTRELRAAAGPTEPRPARGAWTMWDNRWVVSHESYRSPEAEAPEAVVRVAALGEAGLADCPGWREAGLPRTSLLASPAVWQGDRLMAAPLAGQGRGWTALMAASFRDFLRRP